MGDSKRGYSIGMNDDRGLRIISVFGLSILVLAILGRAFITSIADMIILPNTEMFVAKVVDVERYTTYHPPTGDDLSGHTEYFTNLTLDTGEATVTLQSNSQAMYESADINQDMKVFKYKDKYALSQEDINLPKAVNVALYVLMAVGGFMGFLPIGVALDTKPDW